MSFIGFLGGTRQSMPFSRFRQVPRIRLRRRSGRESRRVLIGLGVKEATSPLFVKACDEFIYLKPPGKTAARRESQRKSPAPAGGREIPAIAQEVVASLLARATGPLNPSLIKETIV